MDISNDYAEYHDDQLEQLGVSSTASGELDVAGSEESVDAKPKRLSITLPARTYQRLLDKAEEHNYPSIAESARKSIERDLYLDDLTDKDCDLLYQDSEGKLHRLFPNT